MKKAITIFILVLMALSLFAQRVEGPKFKYEHGDLTIYADKDTCSQVTIHKVSSDEILKLDEGRSNKWHKEKLSGPYKKQYYTNSGYDLGHLTPSHITSYNDTLNYHSFSMLNQAPQLAQFNRGKWSRLESAVLDTIINKGGDAVIITGVIYNNNKKTYLSGSRVKIPIAWFKVLFIGGQTYAWIGSNINGLITVVTLENVNKMLSMNGNKLIILK